MRRKLCRLGAAGISWQSHLFVLRRECIAWLGWMFCAAALAVLAGALMLLPSEPSRPPRGGPGPEPAPPPPEPEPEPKPAPEPAPGRSPSRPGRVDAFVRDGAAPLSNSAVLATLLRTDQSYASSPPQWRT